ncbi:MAG: DUF1178 family protein [Alphaproteobacteria bacterium]
MIKYTVCCSNGHKFDEWFDSINAYEEMEKNGSIKCPICGDNKITRAVMAPQVASKTISNAKATCSAEKKFGSSCGSACNSGSCPFAG